MSKKGFVYETGRFGFFTKRDFSVTFLMGSRLSLTRVSHLRKGNIDMSFLYLKTYFPLLSLNRRTTYQFRSVCDDGFGWVYISSPSSTRDSFSKGLEIGSGCLLHYLINMSHFQTTLQVTLNEWGSQQNLLTKIATNETSSRL